MTSPASITGSHGVQAWDLWHRRLDGFSSPPRVSVIKDKPRSGVYRLLGAGQYGSDVVAKRGRREKIAVENRIYEILLSSLPVQGVRCLDHFEEPDGGSAWLFLEDAGGSCYRPDDGNHRACLAEWLAMLHASARWSLSDQLPDRGIEFFRECLSTICDLLTQKLDEPGVESAHVLVINRVLETCHLLTSLWPQVEQACCIMPRTFVHGDLLPKNMRVLDSNGGFQLNVFDWEYAGWGTPVIDLAQSVHSGDSWASPDLEVYRDALGANWTVPGQEDLRRGASVARLLHLLMWTRGDARNVHAAWIDHPVAKLDAYEREITRILRELAWAG